METKKPKPTPCVPEWKCKKCQKKNGAFVEAIYLRMDGLQKQIDDLKAKINKEHMAF